MWFHRRQHPYFTKINQELREVKLSPRSILFPNIDMFLLRIVYSIILTSVLSRRTLPFNSHTSRVGLVLHNTFIFLFIKRGFVITDSVTPTLHIYFIDRYTICADGLPTNKNWYWEHIMDLCNVLVELMRKNILHLLLTAIVQLSSFDI